MPSPGLQQRNAGRTPRHRLTGEDIRPREQIKRTEIALLPTAELTIARFGATYVKAKNAEQKKAIPLGGPRDGIRCVIRLVTSTGQFTRLTVTGMADAGFEPTSFPSLCTLVTGVPMG